VAPCRPIMAPHLARRRSGCQNLAVPVDLSLCHQRSNGCGGPALAEAVVREGPAWAASIWPNVFSSGRRAGSAVACGRSSRARQTAVVVLDVMLYCGPAITPDKKVAFLLCQRGAYEGWLITSPYITKLTMVSVESWF
jgi:hypothetical protein